MINVGVIGLGMMGATHLDVYAKRSDVRVAAVADPREELRTGKAKATGNIEGQAQGGVDLSKVRGYAEGLDLIADPDVQLVDICLPTPLHRRYAEAALAAGKHLLVEKPLARTSADADAIADAAEKGRGIAMPAMCMRFWPGWTWLKAAVDSSEYGKVLSAHFRRLASHPGGGFYSNGEACGGGILDLHIHDTDFVQHLFGVPEAVYTRGYARPTSEPDHVLTQYLYRGGPMVSAEGGWTMAKGFGFRMQYTVNFERATAMFDIGATPALTLARGGKTETVELPAGMGYEHEIAYLLDCIANKRQPTTVTLRDAARSVAIVEAEAKSIASGEAVAVAR